SRAGDGEGTPRGRMVRAGGGSGLRARVDGGRAMGYGADANPAGRWRVQEGHDGPGRAGPAGVRRRAGRHAMAMITSAPPAAAPELESDAEGLAFAREVLRVEA